MPTPCPKPAPRIVKRAFAAKAGEESSAKAASVIQTRRSKAFRVARHEAPSEVAADWRDVAKASDLFVECLEAEGVRYVFGIPGEETLDLNESLEASSIEFVP